MKKENNLNSEKGAVFAEAALCLSLFFILVLGFIDYTRMMAVESELTVAAEQALTIASTNPGIDSYSFEKSAANQAQSQDFIAAQDKVLNRARDIVLTGKGSNQNITISEESLKIPRTAPYAGATMEQVLETTPIEINLSSTYTPMLPLLPEMTIRGKAVGYREPRKMINMPLIVDCNGNLLGTANYERQPCPCPVDKMWDFVGKRCVCRNNSNNTGDCGCPNGQELTTDYTGCKCITVACSDPNFTQNMATCGCQCALTGGVDSTNCRCRTGFDLNGLSCSCPSNTGLPANTQRSNIDCSIICRSSFVPPPSGSVSVNGCVCPTNRIASRGACVCDNSTCPNLFQVRSGSNCASCNCGSFASLVGNQCQCDSPNRVMDSANNCVCLSNNTCPKAGQRRSGSNCDCACTAPFQDNGGTECTCIDPNMQRSGTTCVCRYAAGTSCGDGKAWNSSCQCACTGGRVADANGDCRCPGAQTVQTNGICGCSGTPPEGASFVGTSCSTSCITPGQEVFGGRCVRPECKVDRCAPFTMSDGSCSGCPEQ
jgi:hypothetical protein